MPETTDPIFMLVRQMPDPCMLTDTGSDRRGPAILFANDAFTRLCGYSPDELVGRSPGILQGAGTDATAQLMFREAILRGEPARIEMLNYRKDGTPYWVEISLTPLHGENGAVSRFLAVGRDVTHHKQAETACERLILQHQLAAHLDQLLETSADETLCHAVLDFMIGIFGSETGFLGYADEYAASVCPPAGLSGLSGRRLTEGGPFFDNKAQIVAAPDVVLNRLMGAPILFRGEWIGSIHVANRQSDYTSADLKLFRSLVDRIAPVLVARAQDCRHGTAARRRAGRDYPVWLRQCRMNRKA